MTDEEVLAWLAAEYARPLVGWDWSYVVNRRHKVGKLPWDLSRTIRSHLRTATAVLDVDTGDGTYFAEALAGSGFQGRASATEGYAPNVPLARATLAPRGVDLRETPAKQMPPFGARDVVAEHLPFADASFDLVLNRQGSLDSAETRRVLRPGGRLVTQQVGNKTNLDIHYLLDAPLPTWPTWDLAAARAEVEAAGLWIRRAQEAAFITRYDDVGALVWVLKAVPWQIPDFSVGRYAGRLLALHRRVERTGEPIDVGFHVFLIVARA